MSLFQPSVLKSHLALLDQQAVDKAYKKFSNYFLNATIQENIKTVKEEQYQATFLTELFVNVFQYTLFPNKNHNLITEQKNETNSRKADGAILKGDAVTAVIELKGTNTKDLESIRKQAFDYKNFNTGCTYVITSNFEKLRFYIDDASVYEEFDLFTLSRKRFELLYLCMYKDSLLAHTPKTIKEQSLVAEEQITKEFYKDYSLFKRELWKDLAKNNLKSLKLLAAQQTSVQEELVVGVAQEHDDDLAQLEKNLKRTLFKKSQKLIDRFLFIFFAEDRGLLQPNYTLNSIAEWETVNKLGVAETLYDRFKLHFNYLDTGRKKADGVSEIFAYNGGLFKPDIILDSVVISNELLLKHTKKIAAYDFESQVDVNILGHIFENSLNEIESVNAEIEGGNFDKQTSKRKKDGVFYTPKYITKYIVDNTVGKLCADKKTELGFAEEEYYRGRKNRNTKTLEHLIKVLDDYRAWLLQLTICDPACGSGAFLNQALDFLINEHNYLDDLKARLLGGSIALSDIENTILENNIYGVDLNEESVEIAKLSLWLRTAQPRRKLNDLSSNIQCGNSLIDVKAVAGDKAFKWEERFPQVFAKGGFDVVIGNPPYVSARQMETRDRDFLTKKFPLLKGAWDLYVPFLLLAKKITKSGVYGWIIPNKLLISDYSEDVLAFLKNTGLDKVINISSLPIFKNVGVYPIIIIQSPESEAFEEYEIFDIEHLDNIKTHIKAKNRFKRYQTIQDFGIEINSGTTGFEAKKIKPLIRSNGSGIKFAVSGSIDPYVIDRYRVPYMKSIYNYPTIEVDMSLLAESKVKFWKLPKIVIAGMTKRLEAYFSNDELALGVGVYGIYGFSGMNPKYLLGLLNSKFLTYYLVTEFYDKHLAGGYLAINKSTIEQLPLVSASENDQEYIAQLTDKMVSCLNSKLTCVESLCQYITKTLFQEKLSRKLEFWHELTFGDFLKELNKAIKTTNKARLKEGLATVAELTKKDEFEWMELFEEKQKEVLELQSQIQQTEQGIDRMVYELYGLSDEEIAIVEAG